MLLMKYMNATTAPEDLEYLTAGFKLIKILLSFIAFTVIVISLLPQLAFLPVVSDSKQSSPYIGWFLGLALLLAVAGLIAKFKVPKIATQPSDRPKDRIAACLKSFHISHLLAFAFFECIALLGLINYLLSSDSNSGIILGAISLICMGIAWPKFRQLEAMI